MCSCKNYVFHVDQWLQLLTLLNMERKTYNRLLYNRLYVCLNFRSNKRIECFINYRWNTFSTLIGQLNIHCSFRSFVTSN